MKIIKKISLLIITICFLTLTSCDLDGGGSLNGASTTSISDDLSRGELPQAMAGVVSDMRVDLLIQTDVLNILGREYYFFTGSDPRFEGDVVTGNLDDNTFYTTRSWGSRYATVKDINLTLQGLENTTADFSADEISVTRGVLNTFKAYELLTVSSNQFQNGIRINVSDPDNLGPFVTYDEALTAISELLTSARNDLSPVIELIDLFPVGAGFDDLIKFDDLGDPIPVRSSDFLEFNNALAARVEAYRGNYSNVLSLLNGSFMDLNGGSKSINHIFSATGGDQLNLLFNPLEQSSPVRVVHSSYLEDAEDGDSRTGKVVFREIEDEDGNIVPNPVNFSELIGTHDVFIYGSNTDNIAMIKNDELILLFAEANMVTNPGDAVNAIDVIRAAAGLPSYSGAQDPAALED
jgi:hypothetical protein